MSGPTVLAPLHGVRVVELATGVAGCYAAKLLADFGADVVKVEPPGGDMVRHWGPFPGADPADAMAEQGALHLHLNTNKRSIVADLDRSADRELVARLAGNAHIVLESFAPGRLDAWGLGWDALRAANPSLVLTSITPFGQDGPYASWRGAEIAAYAMGGPMHATGVAEREPLKLAGQLISYQCGAVSTVATLGALLLAGQSGAGTHVDVANFETQAGCIDRRMTFFAQYVYNGRIMRRDSGAASGLLPIGVYPAADGWVQVVCPPAYAPRLAATLGDEALTAAFADPLWTSDPDVSSLAEALFYGWLADRTAMEAMHDAHPAHLPLTPVRTTAEVIADEHFAERGFFTDIDHPVAGLLRQPGAPFRMAGGWAVRRPAPVLGQHDEEIRQEVAALPLNMPISTSTTGPNGMASSDGAAGLEPALPLAGVRVLDLTMVWAGPYTTMMLGDLGADVIRIEDSRTFNVTRGSSPRPAKTQLDALGWLCCYPDDEPGERPWNRNGMFNIHARNKRSVTVDLRRAEGVELLLRLVEQADVLVENNSVDVIDKLGIGWDELHRRNPRLVLVRMPAMGLTGPMRSVVGFGANFEALCGLTSLRGYRHAEPSLTGAAVYHMDAASGAAGAVATLLALRRRDQTGVGELVELAQGENMLNLIGEYLIDSGRTGRAWSTYGNRHLVDAPQGAYPCVGEDRWVVLSVDGDDAWSGLCRAMGEPAWASEERFATAAGRRAAHDELDAHLGAWTASLDRWEVAQRCQVEGVVAAPVLDEADLAVDPHLRARGFLRRNGSEEVGWHDYPGHLWRWSGPPLRWGGLCPFGGANEEVWRGLVGLSAEEYAALAADGHFVDRFYAPDGSPL